MYQDGSDEKSTLARASHESVTPKGLPPLMSLMLLDSEKTQLLSEIVPLARSYDEAVLSALAAFPQIIPAETLRSSIILKYPCKVLDGPVYWAGIRATMELPELWMSLFEKCGHIPTIGVTVEEQEAKDLLPQEPSISGVMGQQLWIQCFLGHGGAWVGGDAPPTTPLPLTYEECMSYLLQHVYIPNRPALRGPELKQQLALRIFDGSRYLPLSSADYTTFTQKHACTPVGGKRTVYITVGQK